MKKRRNLFSELNEGFTALANQRAGKQTLRTNTVKAKAAPKALANEGTALRER